MKCPNCGEEVKKLKEYTFRMCSSGGCYLIIQKHCPECGWPLSEEKVFTGNKEGI